MDKEVVHIAALGITPGASEPEPAAVALAIELAEAAGHHIVARATVPDSEPAIRVQLASWIIDANIDVVLVVMDQRSKSIGAAQRPLIAERIPGLIEAARCESTIVVVLLPGTNSVRAAMQHRILPRLDGRKPETLVTMMPRLVRAKERGEVAAPPPPKDAVPAAIPAEQTTSGAGVSIMPRPPARKPQATGRHVISRNSGGGGDFGEMPTKPIDLVAMLPTVPPGADEELDATAEIPLLLPEPPRRERTTTPPPPPAARVRQPTPPPPPAVATRPRQLTPPIPTRAPKLTPPVPTRIPQPTPVVPVRARPRTVPPTAPPKSTRAASSPAEEVAKAAEPVLAAPSTRSVPTRTPQEFPVVTAPVTEEIDAVMASSEDDAADARAAEPPVANPDPQPVTTSQVIAEKAALPTLRPADTFDTSGAVSFPEKRKSRRGLWIALAVVALGGAGAFAMTQMKSRPAPQVAAIPADAAGVVEADAAVAQAAVDARTDDAPEQVASSEPEVTPEPAPPEVTPERTPTRTNPTRTNPTRTNPTRTVPTRGSGPVTSPSEGPVTTPAPVTKPPDPTPTPALTPPAADGCDEVSCVLEKYARPCCARFKPSGEQFTPTKSSGGVPQSLDKTMIKAGVASVKPAVVKCGEKAGAKGTVKVSLRVNADGAVQDATVTESPDAALGACVASVMRKARFGKTIDGGSFSYPFVF